MSMFSKGRPNMGQSAHQEKEKEVGKKEVEGQEHGRSKDDKDDSDHRCDRGDLRLLGLLLRTARATLPVVIPQDHS